MTYVAPARKIANPINNAYRIWKDFRPFLEGGIKFREPYRTLYQQVKKDAKEKTRGTKPVEIYYLTNQRTYENLHTLKGYEIVFTPGTSVNLTPEDNPVGAKPAMLGMDLVSDVVTLPDELLRHTAKACEKFEKDYGLETKVYEKIKLIPVNPCVFWIWDIKKEGGWRLVPTFEKELREISDYLTEKGKFGYQTFERRLDLPDWVYEEKGVVGNYEFSTRIADPAKAKVYSGDAKIIEELTYIIRKTIGKACGTVATRGTVDGITHAWMKKSGVERAMIEKMPRKWYNKIDWIGGDEPGQGIMRNTRKLGAITALGESHPSALGIYAGWLYSLAEQDYLKSGGKLKTHPRLSDPRQASIERWQDD